MALALCVAVPPAARAADVPALPELPELTSKDRLLVVAPHPDDETLGAGGLLQRARKAGAAVLVLHLTHGENNELSSILHRKKPLMRRKDFIKNGLLRKDEAHRALRLLGYTDDQTVWLGYPDSALLKLWYSYWNAKRPYRSLLTRISRVPYKDDVGYESDYTADNLLRDVERALLDYRPTHVAVTAPFDANPDHRAAYLFTTAALLNLRDTLPEPVIYGYLIHAEGATAEARAASARAEWLKLELTPEEVSTKKAAIETYASQIAYKKRFLLSFARDEELYARLAPEGIPAGPAGVELTAPSETPGPTLSVRGKELWVDLNLSDHWEELGPLYIHLYGHREPYPFGAMPKVRLALQGQRLSVNVNGRPYRGAQVLYGVKNKRLVVRVPLDLLGKPDRMYVSVLSASQETPSGPGAWQLLTVPQNPIKTVPADAIMSPETGGPLS
ncbi:MAG: 1D-myo-inositol 2-acetamido-2-deoxy-alpha-D-glucopyranoside deacetylase [Candidatus Omnitrophica bacterium]|nr:1D-myo-inositol 2-acetamido-2-deoxy-alpha-D-glucopyranoside deacetylase [Candidatus Omnitrophota bacterium]